MLVRRIYFFSKKKRQTENTVFLLQKTKRKIDNKYKMRAFIVLSCLAFAAARPEAGYSYQRPGGSGGSGGISSGFSGISGSSFGIGGGHGGGGGGGSFGGSFSSGGSSSLSGFGSGGVCLINKKIEDKKIKQKNISYLNQFKRMVMNREIEKESIVCSFQLFPFFQILSIRCSDAIPLIGRGRILGIINSLDRFSGYFFLN